MKLLASVSSVDDGVELMKGNGLYWTFFEGEPRGEYDVTRQVCILMDLLLGIDRTETIGLHDRLTFNNDTRCDLQKIFGDCEEE